jgi:uncharacterized caspase-like protein
MVFDACFSGSLFKSKGTELQQIGHASIRRMLNKSVRFYITAGRENEEVAADSTFAKLLLKGLRGDADRDDEGIISAEDLGNYLLHAVHRYSDRQTPQYGSIADPTLSEGQFFFLTGAGAAGTSAPLAPSGVPITAKGTTANGPGTSNNKSGIK